MKAKPTVGETLTRNFEVLPSNTAAFFASEDGEQYANVLGTPFLIAEMERVCALVLQPFLVSGQVSVGAHIDIRHIASTAVGANYSIKVKLVENRWGLFTFEVVARDNAGEIGKGKIVRAIADLAEIEQRGELALTP